MLKSPGEKVTFVGINGYDHELKEATQLLTKKEKYTVKETNVYGWKSTYQLEEIPDKQFNTVMFQ